MSELNPIVKRMRAALSEYHQKAIATIQKTEKMKAELLPDVAVERIAAAQAELNNVKLVTIDKIMAAAKEGKTAAVEWGKLKANEINQADSALLNSGIKLTQNEYDELCTKYKNNGTMSRILSEYADRHNRQANGQMDKLLFTPCLATVTKKTEVWDRLERTAHMIIGNIDGKRGFVSGAENPLVKESVDNFGLNTEV